MDTINLRIRVAGLLLILLALSGCRVVSATPANEWQTYTNQKHGLSLEIPPGWQFKEIWVSDHAMAHDEVWFAAGEFPQANTDARPEMLLIITEDDPSAQWSPDYFDDYQSAVFRLGEGEGTKISGVNKESMDEESVVIMIINGAYVQAIPGHSKEASEFFDRILASLEPAPEAVPVPDPSAPVRTCISPYFDPVAFLPDPDRILIRSDTGIMVFNLQTLEEEIKLDPARKVVKAALSPDGQTLAWALEDHTVELVELSSGNILSRLVGHTGMVTSIRFSATGKRIYTASHDNSVRIWNADGSLVSEFIPGGGEVLGIGISPDDTKLAIVTFEAPQKLWDLRTNELIEEVGSSGAFDGADASFSPDGKILGIGLGGGPVSLWDVDTRTQVWSGGKYALAISQDGRFFAYSDTDKNGNYRIVMRSLDGLEPAHSLEGNSSLLWKIIISPDGSRLASADGNEIQVWHVTDRALLDTLRMVCP